MERAYYDAKPSKLEAVGNGSYLYRWDIRKEAVGAHAQVQYSCYEVVVWATVTRNKITEAVIGKMWDVNVEQKLINEYNSAKLGIYSGEEANKKIAAYNQFLEERAALKAQIDADLDELGIL